MKKPFKLSSEEIDNFAAIAENMLLSNSEIQDKVNAYWKELGQKHGFLWNSVENDPNSDGYLVEMLTKKAFPEVHAETIPQPGPTKVAEENDYPVTQEEAYPPTPAPQSVTGVLHAGNMIEKTQLVVFLQNSGLAPLDMEHIKLSFLPFFDQSAQWFAIAKTLVVTDESQVAEMKKANDARLALKRIRTSIEGVRKQLKEGINQKAKAIDGIARMLTLAIEPIEDYLDEQAKFGEIQELKRKQALAEERLIELQKYDFQYNQGFHLGDMDEEMYNSLLIGIKQAYQTRKEEERKQEEERAEELRRDDLLTERVANLNKLGLFIYIPADFQNSDLRIMGDAEYNSLVQVAKDAKKLHETEIARAREEADRLKLESERKTHNNRRIATLGILTDGTKFLYKNQVIPIKRTLDELISLPDAEFENAFKGVEMIVSDFKIEVDRQEAEKLLAQQLRNTRLITIQSMGYVMMGEDYVLKDKKGFNFLIIRKSHIDTLSEKLWDELIADHKTKIEAKRIEEIPLSTTPIPEPVAKEVIIPRANSGKQNDELLLLDLITRLNDFPLPTIKKKTTLMLKVRELLDDIVKLIDGELL